MKMSNFSTPAFLKAWSKIFGESKDLSPRLAYKAKSINDYLTDQSKKFVELREAILKKYGTKDDKGENAIVKDGNIEFKNECLNDVNREFSELMQLDLEPAAPSRLKVEETRESGIKLSGPDVSLLAVLIDFGDEAAKPALTVVPPQPK